MEDVNIIIIGGVVVALAVTAYQAHRLEKRNKVLEARLNFMRVHRNQWEEKAFELTGTVTRLSARIAAAIAQGVTHPNTRPNKVLELLRGDVEHDTVRASLEQKETLFQKLTRPAGKHK